MDRLIAEIKVDKDELREICKEVVKNIVGKPELEGMTNGQVVMQALLPLFPNLKAVTIYEASFGRHIELTNNDIWIVHVPVEWWEEPYEGGKK